MFGSFPPGRRTVRGDRAGARRELWGVRRPEGVAAATSAGRAGGEVHGGASDALRRPKRRGQRQNNQRRRKRPLPTTESHQNQGAFPHRPIRSKAAAPRRPKHNQQTRRKPRHRHPDSARLSPTKTLTDPPTWWIASSLPQHRTAFGPRTSRTYPPGRVSCTRRS